MTKITKETSIVSAISANPLARPTMLKYGIKFVGKGLSPLESVEKVGRGNGLDDKTIEKMLEEMNKTPEKRTGTILTATDEAAVKLKTLISSKGKKGIRLRLVSDGCATYVYDMDFATKRVGDEIEIKSNGVTFYIDPKSLDFIQGTKIDYNTNQEGFVFDNPNVKK